MRVAIVGSRNFPDLWKVEEFVEKLSRKYPHSVVVSGGGGDVDVEAERSADSRMLHKRIYKPKRRYRDFNILLIETGRFVTTIRDDDGRVRSFKTFGQAAFYRNSLIVNDCDQLIAFHYQDSKGTQDSIDKARALGKPVHVYYPT